MSLQTYTILGRRFNLTCVPPNPLRRGHTVACAFCLMSISIPTWPGITHSKLDATFILVRSIQVGLQCALPVATAVHAVIGLNRPLSIPNIRPKRN